MARSPKPSELELQVLALLWDRGPLTVREVLEGLPDGKERAYTTVLSVLQVMEKKGLVTHTRKGLSHVYRPAVEKKQVLRPVVRDMLRNFFSGRPSQVMQHLLGDGQVTAEELEEMKRLVEAARRKQQR